MSTLSQRLARLESAAPAGVAIGRFIRVGGGGQHDDAAMWTFLETQGVRRRPGDMIVMRSVWRPSDHGPVGAEEPLRLLDFIDVHHTHEEALAELD